MIYEHGIDENVSRSPIVYEYDSIH